MYVLYGIKRYCLIKLILFKVILDVTTVKPPQIQNSLIRTSLTPGKSKQGLTKNVKKKITKLRQNYYFIK